MGSSQHRPNLLFHCRTSTRWKSACARMFFIKQKMWSGSIVFFFFFLPPWYIVINICEDTWMWTKGLVSKETAGQGSGESNHINCCKYKCRIIKVFNLVRDSKFHHEVEWELAKFFFGHGTDSKYFRHFLVPCSLLLFLQHFKYVKAILILQVFRKGCRL